MFGRSSLVPLFYPHRSTALWEIIFAVSLVHFLSGISWAEAPKSTPSLCKINYPSDAKVQWECRRLKKGETLEGLFGGRWIDVARFNRVDRRHAYPGVYLKIPMQLEDIRDFTPMPHDYPEAEGEAKFILVDLSEQFLGAYEYGRMVFSAPIAAGEKGHETPSGEFRITAFHRNHVSSLYFIEDRDIPYPMNYALRFYIAKTGISYWIHGRDMPGHPASHGCIGLYDEPSQKRFYQYPENPVLEDARTLYEWVIAPLPDDGKFHPLKDGPWILIVGSAPG